MMNKRRVPQQERARKTVVKILTAAQEILENEGEYKFTTTHIAKTAHVGVGTLYDYFPDREAIARALLDDIASREAAQIDESLTKLAEVKSFKTLAQELVSLVYGLYRDHAKLYDALWEIAKGSHAAYERPGERKIVDAVSRILFARRKELGHKVEDPQLVAFVVVYMIEGLCSRLNHEDFAPGDHSTREAEVQRAVLQYLGIKA